MSAPRMPSDFVVVGRGTLAVGCCQVLAERGLRVRHLAAACELAELGWDGAAPVLLSIGNEELIAPAVLGRFAQAFNFHDGPLPRYAGSHVTSWALMDRARTYAVSWHRMNARADAGDIVLQAHVPIAAGETALTLNAKCHAIALKSFAVLAEKLAQHAYGGIPQFLGARKFYPRDRKADNLAILDWENGADALWALVRALAFGPYVNRVGLAKVQLPGGFAGVRSLGVCASRSTVSPGTLVSMTQDAFTVATATHDVRLQDFVTLDGCDTSVTRLAQSFGVREGDVLPRFDPDAIGAVADQACGWKEEQAWMSAFHSLAPLASPLRNASGQTAGTHRVLSALGRRAAGASRSAGDFSLAVLLACLGRMAGAETFDVGLCCARVRTPDGCIERLLLADMRPFRVHLDFDEPFESFGARFQSGLDTWRTRKAYLRDAVLRYPGVARPPGWNDFCSWPVSIELDADAAHAAARALSLPSAASIRFTIAPSTGQVDVLHGGARAGQLDRFAAQLGALVEDCLARPQAALGDLALLTRPERTALLMSMCLPPPDAGRPAMRGN
jgi:methionyl-tRNA formyltransferase